MKNYIHMEWRGRDAPSDTWRCWEGLPYVHCTWKCEVVATYLQGWSNKGTSQEGRWVSTSWYVIENTDTWSARCKVHQWKDSSPRQESKTHQKICGFPQEDRKLHFGVKIVKCDYAWKNVSKNLPNSSQFLEVTK